MHVYQKHQVKEESDPKLVLLLQEKKKKEYI